MAESHTAAISLVLPASLTACAACAERLRERLAALSGVRAVSVRDASLRLEHEPDRATSAELERAAGAAIKELEATYRQIGRAHV